MVVNPRCVIWKYFDNIVEEGTAVCKLCKQRLKNTRSFSLRKHINKLHNPDSVIWKYFDNIVEECVAVCKLCDKRVRNNRHFNLIIHLKQHDLVVLEKKNEIVNSSHSLAKQDGNSCEYLYIRMDEKTLVDAVMGLMIDEEIPPQLFGSKNMQSLLNPVCDAISKEETIQFRIDDIQSEQVVHSVASYIRDEFSDDLHWRLLSLRMDGDVNSDSNTFCLSVQFINEIQVESRTLGEINLEEEQQLSGEDIIKLLHKFNIDSRQIVSVCWDNSKAKLNKAVSNSEYLQEIEQFEKNPQINVGDLKVERYIGIIAQLCVLDTLKNSAIFPLFIECRDLVKLVNEKSHIFNDEFKKKSVIVPQLDSPWKWGSTCTMMKDLKGALTIIENMRHEQPVHDQENRFSLNDNIKEFLDAFCETFTHIHKCAEKFYTSEMIYGDFYAQWLKCKLLTEKIYSTCKKGTILATISAELVKNIEKRSVELLNQDHFNACLYLDPRFQHTLSVPEKMFVLEYLKQLWNRSKLYNAKLADPVSEARQINPQHNEKFDDDGDAFLNEFLSQCVQESDTTGIYKKLEDLKLLFQVADTNVLRYWKELKFCEPEIYSLTTICFAIPATQNYNKTYYAHNHSSSFASNISPDLKENLNLIRLNQHLLDEAREKLGLFREDIACENDLSDKPSAAQISVAHSTVSDSQPSTSGISIMK